MSLSIQRVPAKCTTRPMAARVRPVAITPPWASAILRESIAIPDFELYPVTAAMGAMSAKEDPR